MRMMSLIGLIVVSATALAYGRHATWTSRSTARWSLRQLPTSAQFSCASRDEAIDAARKFAREQEVDLWECEHEAYTLLETFRVTEGRP